MPADRFGKGGERGRFKALCQRFFRNRSAYTTIAILKWVDRFKPQMRDTRPRDRRQRSCPCGRAVVEPCDKRLHFGLHAVRWRRFVVDAWSMKSAQIGRASGRDRVGKHGWILGGAVRLNKK